MSRLPPETEMQRAWLARDAAYDGIFYLAVRSTGIFCRPSCPARKPQLRNVRYFATPADALRAGFRPCRRCHPLHTDGSPPEWIEPLFAALDGTERLRDDDVRALAISPTRVRRYFRRNYGMTFQAYQRARRLGAAVTDLHKGERLLDVAFGQGYESSSGFREAFAKAFGRSPGRSRAAACIVAELIESPIGPLLACADSQAVVVLEFPDAGTLKAQAAQLRQRLGAAVVPGTNEVLRRLRRELGEYFARRRRDFAVPVAYRGTPFQCAVWNALRRIPYGETISYEELARRVGHPGAQRAVGTANHHNRISIVIPCHRVVNKSGQLGGYGGGLWRKQYLLDLERA
jgi:AraC family transcriptional regulator, regulatory protein of adaptative response / methylated-DNA-[protein]-cysteine methyltransferase